MAKKKSESNPIDEIISNVEAERSEPTDMPPDNFDQIEAELDGSENAPAQSESSPQPTIEPLKENPPGGLTDAKGTLWDEAIHENPPRRNADNEWAKKRGRRGGSKNSTAQTVPIGVDVRRVECRQAAQTVCLQIFTLAQAFLGQEWAPQVNAQYSIDEREMMISAWEEYFLETGIIKMPPWLGLTVVMGSYAFPRLMQAKYLDKLNSLKEWIFGGKKDEEFNHHTSSVNQTGIQNNG